MPYDDRTAYRLVFDDNGADMMTPGPGWCRALKVVFDDLWPLLMSFFSYYCFLRLYYVFFNFETV